MGEKNSEIFLRPAKEQSAKMKDTSPLIRGPGFIPNREAAYYMRLPPCHGP